MKQLEDNPWMDADNKYPENAIVKGKVRGFTDYGAFVELDDGLEGMIHISDMSWTRKINHPQDVLEKGQEVEVMVLGVDEENRKINLGLKQREENPWQLLAEKYPVNKEMEAEVVQNSNYGVFVKLGEVDYRTGEIFIMEVLPGSIPPGAPVYILYRPQHIHYDVPCDQPGVDIRYGPGRVNVKSAIEHALK